MLACTRRRMLRIDAGEYAFYFAYDLDSLDRLHVEVRSGIDVQTVIDTFFQGLHSWNAVNERFECHTQTH
jgi:hypothetical protein